MRRTSALSAAFLIATLPAIARAQQVRYEVSFPNAAHHEAEVAVTFQDIPDGPLEVRMSRTSPGRYALHEFAKNVYRVRAVDGAGSPLRPTRPDPHQWNVAGHDGTVRITYTLFGDRVDGTYTAIDLGHAHMNMPATFMWARGMEEVPIEIRFDSPNPAWRIATQLFPTGDSEVYTAPDLAYFLDSPTELSDHAVREWRVSSGGETYAIRLAVHHEGTDSDLDQYAAMARRVVAEQIGVFGQTPAYDMGTYTFIADYLPHSSGDGMEHRNSTVLTGTTPLSAGALSNLGTLSHEFFHGWNVERIRPRSLEPFDFEAANMSGELWFAEGFTSYYDALFIRRAGLTDNESYARGISGSLNTVINGPGRRLFSPVEMSMKAPLVDAATSVDLENRANTFISYYTWGSAIGLGLDLTLRTRFDRTLDDYMRAMWMEFGRTERPYTPDDLRNVLADVAGDAAFAREFFDRYVEGTEVMDYEELLSHSGYLLRLANPSSAWLGARISNRNGQAMVASIPSIGSPLYDAGLDEGAVIAAVDGSAVSAAEFLRIVASRNPGDRLPMTYQFRGSLYEATVVLTEDPAIEVVTFETSGRPVTDPIRAFRDSWFGSRAR